ncbi:MBL fold metallo-hydrolase [Gracilibacillus kekensis]|uniref:Glyoxylase, beta-lactamase superfamily II n=1 Tax=Gracilibacillus kekensis TaxID=1027249 RepID=A0A1M7QGM6_9BACI|nr:MBL fold metallo-hydrolase [Gracilibacillus kekensis]SHN30135.1 Glyoxylase, beta-lactamase superfamily II [Gracilibacillus kekensis]
MNVVEIIRIPILPMEMLNAHLLKGPEGCILIDAGVPGSEEKIIQILESRGLRLQDIKLIIISHAHMDHAGAAAKLRDLSNAPILAHEDEVKYFQQEAAMTFCPTGWFGRVFQKTSLNTRPYTAFTPDILLSKDQVFDLSDYGVGGIARHTPGHTEGSISVELDSKEALVGDLIASGILLGGIMMKNRPKRPPFEENPHLVSIELQKLLQSGNQKFYMGHGGPLQAPQIQRHIYKLRNLSK